MDFLLLPDGRRIALGERATGGSKNETRYGELDGQAVVVKIQRTHGRLRQEEQALLFLSAHALHVPTIISSGTTPGGAPVLAITHEPGAKTDSPAGWYRFGRTLAAVAGVPAQDCPLPRHSSAAFVADHRSRLEAVGAIVDDETAEHVRDALTEFESSDELVVTHGDPGTGNYLDNNAGPGVLLDWETASVSPFGLDLGRAAFIGLLDLHGTGRACELAEAVVHGYREGLDANLSLSDRRLNAAIIITGLQFIHGRLTKPLLPERTAEMATATLRRYLARNNPEASRWDNPSA